MEVNQLSTIANGKADFLFIESFSLSFSSFLRSVDSTYCKGHAKALIEQIGMDITIRIIDEIFYFPL